MSGQPVGDRDTITGVPGARWALLSRFTITKDGSVYLDRLRIVQTPWFGVYLHRIARPDGDRDVHDHPWNFASCILRGGYTERYVRHPHLAGVGVPRTWRRWSWHRMGRDAAHRIVTVEPRTVSLVLVGRRRGEWGFWTDDGWEPWRDYLTSARAQGWSDTSLSGSTRSPLEPSP